MEKKLVIRWKLVKDTSDDMFIVDMDEVMTISESTDIEMIVYYQEFVRRSSKTNHTNLDRKMGYISTVNEASCVLREDLWRIR